MSIRHRSTTRTVAGALVASLVLPVSALAHSHHSRGLRAHRAHTTSDPYYSTSCGPWTPANPSLAAIAQQLGRTPDQVGAAVRADKAAIAALGLAPPPVGEPGPGYENISVVFTRTDLPGVAAFAATLSISHAQAQAALARYICGSYQP
jgi:hypothetical protein